jgi:pimeloyl-ACP methyl ester carboxylesterase
MRRTLAVAALSLLAAATIAPAAFARSRKVASQAVTFTVQNIDRSKLVCGADGATYQIKGHVVGPRSGLVKSSRAPTASAARRGPRTTLYLHGLGLGEWFWHFTSVPGYDYASAQAKRGHFSVVIDRLGYGASGHPDGNRTCLGAQADIAHQIVQALKSGSYAVASGKPRKYRRVALAGHSASGEISILEAYSYRDVNALVVVAFSFSNLPAANTAFGNQRNQCQSGQTVGPGYAFFGQTSAEFEQTFFHSAVPAVRSRAVPQHPADPCGINLSLIDAINQQRAGARKIKVPALVICGANDALYAPFACEAQAERFGSRDKRSIIIRNAGHGLPLERPAKRFRAKLGGWLAKRGF